METTAPKAFVQVFIKSADDLPKEKGHYYAHGKKGGILYFPFETGTVSTWLNRIDWYLKPVDHVSYGREEIIEKLMDAKILLYKAAPFCIEDELSESIRKFLFSLPDTYWYCPTCDEEVRGIFVTYEETHDPKHGCGNPVVCKFKPFATELSELKDGVKDSQNTKLSSQPTLKDFQECRLSGQVGGQEGGQVNKVTDEIKELKEDNANVFLIDRDANSARLYKNGVRVSPEEFTTIYGCEMTEDQKKLLEVIKRDYFNALPEVKESGNEVTDEPIKKIACQFFRHWWNSPGNNTEQGFDAWWKQNKHKYLHPVPPLTDEMIEKWAAGRVNQIDPLEWGYGDLLIEGAKAMRDGKIK